MAEKPPLPAKLRIVSLIPSATEIVAALGLADWLVGRSHECDYPAEVQTLPICTAANLDPKGNSQQIHDRVSELLTNALSIYRLDLQLLADLQPSHILTQAKCDVCAVSLTEVEQAVGQLVQKNRLVQGQMVLPPQLISLQPGTLAEVWSDIRHTAKALGVSAEAVLHQLQTRVNDCEQLARKSSAPTVACIEWTEPLMAAGNWVPELVTLAGGKNLFGQVGRHSPWLDWADLVQANPDVIVFMPCGFNLHQTQQAVLPLAQRSDWSSLKAVQSGQVYVTDGNQYFNRPGPRLVDSLEILAEILHPDLFDFGHRGAGWEVWPAQP